MTSVHTKTAQSELQAAQRIIHAAAACVRIGEHYLSHNSNNLLYTQVSPLFEPGRVGHGGHVLSLGLRELTLYWYRYYRYLLGEREEPTPALNSML